MIKRNSNQNHRTAELLPAFLWICDDCGTENFERTVVAEMSPEELIEMKFEKGIEPMQDGNFLTMPPFVECKHCGSQFKAAYFDYSHDDEHVDDDQ